MQISQHCESKLQVSQPRIRVGLLLDDQLAPRWVHETIEQLLCAETLELVVIVLNGKSRARQSRSRSILFTLWRSIDRWAFASDVWAPKPRPYPVQTLSLAPGMRTPSYTEASQLRECNLDVLVQLGSGDLAAEFLSCAKYGLWAFHYGGYTKAEGEVALFWNLNSGRCTYELILRSATANPRRDWVLCRHIFAIHLFSLEYNLALDCRRRTQILLRRLSDLCRQGWANIAIADIEGNGGKRRIDSASLDRATLSWIIRSLRRLLEKVCFQEQWVIGCCKINSLADSAQARLNPLTLVVPPRGQNYADPFPFEHKGKIYIFFEQYADDGIGTICCAELSADGTPRETQRVLKRNYHLSYPFIFEWHGDIYLLPETWDNRTVEVYGAIDFPHRWELAAVLLSNVTAVDPTILEHNGKLWLFAAGLGGLGTEWSELSMFFADSLFDDWHPHPKNPIVRDMRTARPAGRFFFQQELLIRPGQDCSERYGHAVSLNRVDVLSETDYSETPLTTVAPNWMPGLLATHTLNQQSGFRVLDGQMLVPRWVPLERKLRAFLAGSRS